MPHLLALFGHPVSHSISPRLHEAFGRRTGIDLVYELRDTAPGTLGQALETFAAEGGVGGNVTLPLKVEARDCCASLSRRAEAAGAVNTLKREDGAWYGDNTDGAGFYRDLTANLGFDPRGSRVLVVGAGGAAAGILAPLLEGGPDTLVVANRTGTSARSLARHVDDPRVAGCGLDLLQDMSAFDLVINATSAGHAGQVPDLPPAVLREGGWCCDLSYGEPARAFLEWARRHGADHCFDGRGMLVEQGAESFEWWFGVRPDTSGLAEALSL